MPTITRRNDIAPEPVSGDQWTLFLQIARSSYPEVPLPAFCAGSREGLAALARLEPR